MERGNRKKREETEKTRSAEMKLKDIEMRNNGRVEQFCVIIVIIMCYRYLVKETCVFK